jgi:processive 1,2-diacylglycerol beta-glucosyltransferase
MDLAPKPFRLLMQSLFHELTQSLAGQHMLGYLYDAADSGRAKARFQQGVENLCLVSMLEKVAELRPSSVVCTHFLPAQLLATLRRRSSILARSLPVCTVLTDLDLQYMWVQDVDCMFVPREEARTMIQAYTAAAARPTPPAIVSGIPIHPRFTAKASAMRAAGADARAAMRLEALTALGKWETPAEIPEAYRKVRRLSWPPPSWPPAWPDPADPRPLVVLMSSGSGVTAVYSALLRAATPLRVVVVTGRMADCRAALGALDVPPRHAVKLLGYVDQMPTLLSCASLLVSKSGGLTIAEAAALGVPMVVLDPIPGQETRNADVLLEAGAALKINDVPLLPSRVDAVLGGHGAKRADMAAAISGLGRPDAAFVVADAVLGGEVAPRAIRDEGAPHGKAKGE